MVPWYHSNLSPKLAETSDLIVLEATVQSEDPRGTPYIEYPWRLRKRTTVGGHRSASEDMPTLKLEFTPLVGTSSVP